MIINFNLRTEYKDLLKKSQDFIDNRRKKHEPAIIFTPSSENAKEVAALMVVGGIVGIPFGPAEKRIFILATVFDDQKALHRLNDIKGRPKSQTTAIGCLPEHTEYFAELDSNLPLVTAAKLLGEQKIASIIEQCYQHPVGLMLKAKSHLPDNITGFIEGGRTVLTVGAVDPDEKGGMYNMVLRELAGGFGKALAGSSANLVGKRAYSAYDQDKAYESFKYKIDGFIKLELPKKRPSHHRHLTSSTIIDITSDIPIVKRWGSTHPKRFKSIFPNLVVPKGVSKEEKRESDLDLLRDKINTILLRLLCLKPRKKVF